MYREAHNNAVQFLHEAELLFEKKNFPRAYSLAFTGLEEIAKSQLAADVVTGYIEEKVFWEYFKSHNKKIGRMVWASLLNSTLISNRKHIWKATILQQPNE